MRDEANIGPPEPLQPEAKGADPAEDLWAATPETLLARAYDAGLSASAEGERLIVRGPRSAEEIARVLLGRKADVLAVLRGGSAADAWDQAEADRLLAGLRAEATRTERDDFGGRFPPATACLVADVLAVSEGYARNHAAEVARGWDALELLRGMRPLLDKILGQAIRRVMANRVSKATR